MVTPARETATCPRWPWQPGAGTAGGLPGLFVHDRFAGGDSGCPRAAQWRGRWQGRRAPAMREAGEPPGAAAVPGAAEVAGAPCRSGMGVKLPGPFRGDGLGNHRMHDILLACGPPCSGAVIDIVLERYDSLAAPNSSVRSLGMPPLVRKADGHVVRGPPRCPPVTARGAAGRRSWSWCRASCAGVCGAGGGADRDPWPECAVHRQPGADGGPQAGLIHGGGERAGRMRAGGRGRIRRKSSRS
jgi:hypothetical protein